MNKSLLNSYSTEKNRTKNEDNAKSSSDRFRVNRSKRDSMPQTQRTSDGRETAHPISTSTSTTSTVPFPTSGKSTTRLFSPVVTSPPFVGPYDSIRTSNEEHHPLSPNYDIAMSGEADFCIPQQRHRTATPLRPDSFALTPAEKIEKISGHFEQILSILGLDLTDDSIRKTPHRVAKMYVSEIFCGLLPEREPTVSRFKAEGFAPVAFSSLSSTAASSTTELFSSTSTTDRPSSSYQSPARHHHAPPKHRQMVFVKAIDVYSCCEHHLLPFIGKAHVAYIPSDGQHYRELMAQIGVDLGDTKNKNDLVIDSSSSSDDEKNDHRAVAQPQEDHHTLAPSSSNPNSLGASETIDQQKRDANQESDVAVGSPKTRKRAKRTRSPLDTDQHPRKEEKDPSSNRIIGSAAHIPTVAPTYVLGLSKLNRLVDYYARRPQVQERLTAQIADAIAAAALTVNVAVMVDAKHFCVACRGVQDRNSSTVTFEGLGVFSLDRSRQREEFFRLCGSSAPL